MYFTLVCISVLVTAAYCSTPNSPVNGSVHSQTGTKLGSTLRFSCDQGFRLVGQSSATCTRTPQGIYQWNAPVPLCQGGLKLLTQNHLVLIPKLFIYIYLDLFSVCLNSLDVHSVFKCIQSVVLFPTL